MRKKRRASRRRASDRQARERRFADGTRIAISDRARRRELSGAVGTVVSFGRTRYLVQLDDGPGNGRWAGTRWRCYEDHLVPSAVPPPLLPPSASPSSAPHSPPLIPSAPRAAAPAMPLAAWPALTFARPTPEWVRSLVAEVLDEYGVPPILAEWRPSPKRRRPRGLGFADLSRRRIVVRDNGTREEQRMTVLHELAHIIVGLPGHRLAFWDVCWQLYRDRDVDLDAALRRSAQYKRAQISYRRVVGGGRATDPA